MPAAVLSAWLDSYRHDFKTALQAAARDGYRGLFANSSSGEFNPRAFSSSARRHLRRYLSDLGLDLSGVAAEFSGAGLAEPSFADQRVEHLRETLELCRELQAPATAVRIAGFADPQRAALAQQTLAATAELADRFGVRLAVHTDAADDVLLVERVRSLACPWLRVGVDTAQLSANDDTAGRLAGLMGDVYLRDVRRRAGHIEEVPFGEGDVDFHRLLGALDAGGFDGPLVVRRDASSTGVDAMRQAREYMSALLARSGTRG